MSAPEPPLSIEPVLGWRVWRLVRVGGRLALCSLTQDAVWTPDRAMHARCGRRSSTHRAPSEGCSCGLYATSTPGALARAGVFNPGTGVVGAIAMWGRVVEHGRGARSEFAYPARLRLVCGTCLAQGSGAVAPTDVVESGGVLVPVCPKHLAGQVGRTVNATAIQAELLSTFGVELLPIERVDRSLRIRHRSAPLSVVRVLEHPVRALFILANVFFAAMTVLFVVGTTFTVAFAIIGGVGRAVFGHDAASPTPAISAPGEPLDDVGITVPVRVTPIRSDLPDRVHDGGPGAFPPFAFLCGVPDGRRVDIVPCAGRLRSVWGFAVREAPHGPGRDCMKGWDGYSHGRRFWVCWERATGAPEVERWTHSVNPWSVPVDEGGAIHEHR